jgi:hypothetical protein
MRTAGPIGSNKTKKGTSSAKAPFFKSLLEPVSKMAKRN